MAYGDVTDQYPAVPWEQFEYIEYLFRLEEDLATEEIFSGLRQTLADEERQEMIAAHQLDAHFEDEDLYLWEAKG